MKSAFRGAFLGFLFGVGLCISQKWNPDELYRLLITAAFFPLVTAKLSKEWRAVVNAVATPLSFLTLKAASSASVMHILSTGESFPNPWFPTWLCVTLVVGLEAAVIFFLFRAFRKKTSFVEIEVKAFWGIAIPVFIWLLNSYNQVPLNGMEFVHDAESPICANAIMEGKFPWRDCQTTPGIFHGLIRGWVGIHLFGNTNWAIAAGSALFFQPLCWIFIYFLLLQLVGPNQTFLLLLFLVLPFTVRNLFSYIFLRLCLYPAALGLSLATLRTRHVGFCVAATVLQVALAIVTPESSFLLPAFFLVLFLSEWRERVPFRLTRTMVLTAVGVSLLFLLFLYANDSLKSFRDYYISYTRDLRFSRSVPFMADANDWYYLLAMFPPVLYIFWAVFLLYQWVKKERISPEQWLMGMISFGAILYYQKYLNQPDAHVVEPFVAVFPCFAWMFFQGYRFIEDRFPPLIFVAAGLFVIGGWPGQIFWAYNPYKYSVSSPMPAEFERVGWTVLPQKDRQAILDFKDFFSQYSTDEDSVWDLSGSPALFHYVLKRKNPSPHIISVEANHIETGELFAADIRKSRPQLAILYSETCPWSFWSGVPIAARNYPIRLHALQNYKPLLTLDGYLIMQRNDLDIKISKESIAKWGDRVTTKDLYQHGGVCDWGYAPNFLKTAVATEPSIPVKSVPTGTGTTLEIPPGIELRDYRYLEIALSEKGTSEMVLTDQSRETSRGVTFNVVPRGLNRLRIPVGSCGQWFAFRGKQLFMAHNSSTKIANVSLSR